MSHQLRRRLFRSAAVSAAAPSTLLSSSDVLGSSSSSSAPTAAVAIVLAAAAAAAVGAAAGGGVGSTTTSHGSTTLDVQQEWRTLCSRYLLRPGIDDDHRQEQQQEEGRRRAAAAEPLASHHRSRSFVASGSLLTTTWDVLTKRSVARCDAPPPPPSAPTGGVDPSSDPADPTKTTTMKDPTAADNSKDNTAEPYYHGLFPERQLWRPKVPYPLWDKNWDGREPTTTGDKQQDRDHARFVRKHGVTRHIILVRHGQYDEDEKEDDKRRLTDLGRIQAELTGRRLRDMIEATVRSGGGEFDGSSDDSSNNNSNQFSCRVTALRVSDMTRAKETANIIALFLPGVAAVVDATTATSEATTDGSAPLVYHGPDPSLNEGRPCHHIPGVRATPKVVEVTDDNHRRIETAFQRYFYRADPPPSIPVPSTPNDDGAAETASSTPATALHTPVQDRHEFEIIVCHANVIRYFVCRALQLPPEAWLRFCPFNCSLTYLTIRPTGSVSCRLLGDVGHIPYTMTSFSKHLGYNW